MAIDPTNPDFCKKFIGEHKQRVAEEIANLSLLKGFALIMSVSGPDKYRAEFLKLNELIQNKIDCEEQNGRATVALLTKLEVLTPIISSDALNKAMGKAGAAKEEAEEEAADEVEKPTTQLKEDKDIAEAFKNIPGATPRNSGGPADIALNS